jgi:hypothetical protein
VSRTQLIRNALLAAVAVVAAAAGPGPAIDTWFKARTTAELAVVGLGATVILVGPFALAIWLEVRKLRVRVDEAERTVRAIPRGPTVGVQAPGFEIADSGGHKLSLPALCAAGKPVALLFVRPGCGPSQHLIPEAEHWQRTFADRLTIGIVGRGITLRYDEEVDRHGVDGIFERDPVLEQDVDSLFEVLEAYRITATPAAVIVSPSGVVLSPTADGKQGIEALIRVSLGRMALAARTGMAAASGLGAPLTLRPEPVTHG